MKGSHIENGTVNTNYPAWGISSIIKVNIFEINNK